MRMTLDKFVTTVEPSQCVSDAARRLADPGWQATFQRSCRMTRLYVYRPLVLRLARLIFRVTTVHVPWCVKPSMTM